MRAITVRNLDDEVHRALMERAHANKRSMEAEAREILTREVRAEVAFPNVLVEFHNACREDPAELPEITRDVEPPRVEFE